MYDGVKEMIAAEKKLRDAQSKPKVADPKKTAAPIKAEASKVGAAPKKAGAGEVLAGPHLKKIEDLKGFPVFPDGNKSLLCKYLTKEIYKKYAGKKDKAGVSFE